MEVDIVYLLNLQYLYYQIYLSQVIIIQKNYRMFVNKSRYHRIKHMKQFQEILKDIIEISYMPPIRDNLKILESGGYHYREGSIHFNKLKKCNRV